MVHLILCSKCKRYKEPKIVSNKMFPDPLEDCICFECSNSKKEKTKIKNLGDWFGKNPITREN